MAIQGLHTLDDYVEAFELACQEHQSVDLRQFLPDAIDPLYKVVRSELIRIDLELSWQSGRPRGLEDYRADFPDLFADPESLQAVAFEEYRLLCRAGRPPMVEDYATHYGVRVDTWPVGESARGPSRDTSIQIDGQTGLYRPVASDREPDVSIRLETLSRPGGHGSPLGAVRRGSETGFPEVGSEFVGFSLLEELGRGAFGRVFLARQAALADRPVALKVATDLGDETQALAQLQHTHIVPIHSFHRAGRIQAVCMPYRGHVTLADVLKGLASAPPATAADGTELLRPLAVKPRPAGAPPAEGEGPLRDHYRQFRYPEAVLWLGARLAEGLQHAHQRGIIHRDIKPANVLLTDEGLPMLLDFNLAEDIKQRGLSEALIGGTLPYMAPEQLAVFRGDPRPLDGRCDVYSLGLVLFELLTGRHPFSDPRPSDGSESALKALIERMLQEREEPPCPRSLNPAISPAAASIVRHCLMPDPARRYPSAGALAEDVERQLRHQPLRYAPDRSVRERAAKWARRHPRMGLWLTGAVALALLVVAVGLGLRARSLAHSEAARQAHITFAKEHDAAQFLLSVRPESANQRQEGESACRRALAVYQVGETDWSKGPLLAALPPQEREVVLAGIGELLLLLAALPGENRDAAATREALGQNQLAESCFPPGEVPAPLWAQRAALLDALGEADAAKEARKHAAGPIAGPRDRHLRARELARAGRFREAEAMLLPAVEAHPDRYWPLFLLGLCHEGLGRDSRALAAYTACVALRPDFHGAYVNRGLVGLRLKDFASARRDFDRALVLAPGRVETFLDRALARQGQGDLAGAVADLTAALQGGISATRVYFLRARVRARAGDQAGAKADHEAGLAKLPTDELSWIARGIARMNREPKQALADFDQALTLNPSSRAARMNRAHVLAEVLNQQAPARDELRLVLALRPEHVPALAGLAVVEARLGQRAEAHRLMREALDRDASGLIRYQAGCVYALTSSRAPADADTALVHLRRAIEAGFGLNLLARDPDLMNLRDKPGFLRLTQGASLLRAPK